MGRLKREILQNYHHELSTPLTNILLPLEIAINKKFDDPEEQSHFLRTALSNASRLESLVSDLILLSNIDQGNLNRIRQPVNVDLHLLSPIRKRLERYVSKKLDFRPIVELEGEIRVPRREFVHSVLHLVDNAFKFSPDQGKVNLSIKDTGDNLEVTVRDEGHGVPLALQEKVFERFFQASHGDARCFEGLGVGLTIARAVFQSNGGSLKFLDNSHGCGIQAVFPK
jgi:two-component system phosphate regulon sensor histidine kinase PhoR